MINKYMIFLHLFYLIGAIGINAIASNFIEINAISAFGSIVIFYLAFNQLSLNLEVPSKLQDKAIKEKVEKNKDKIIKEQEQIRRKIEFQSAFESIEEKERKEKNSREFDHYIDELERAKSSFFKKELSEMDDYEKAVYFENRFRKYKKIMSFPAVLGIFMLGFITLLGNYINLITTLILCSSYAMIIFTLGIFVERIRKEYVSAQRKIEPEIINQFFKDLGIRP